MIRRKKFVLAILIVVVIMLFSVTIAYSVLSKSLSVSVQNVTQQAMTWDIGFQPGTVSGEASSTNSLIQCGDATVTKNMISGISTVLAGVGDKCSYPIQIVNNGTIAGIISNITFTEPLDTNCNINGSTMVCGDITYQMHYDNSNSSNLLEIGDIINEKSGSSVTIQNVVLTIEHTGSVASLEDYNQSGFAYQLTYAQH